MVTQGIHSTYLLHVNYVVFTERCLYIIYYSTLRSKTKTDKKYSAMVVRCLKNPGNEILVVVSLYVYRVCSGYGHDSWTGP